MNDAGRARPIAPLLAEGSSPLSGHGHLLWNIVLFGRLLRAAGLTVTPAQILDLVEGLAYIDIHRRRDFKEAARAILVSRSEHLPLFDRAFDLFWRARPEEARPRLDLDRPGPKPPRGRKEAETLQPPPGRPQANASEPDSQAPEAEKACTYSVREVLRQKDFAALNPDELLEVKRLMQALAWDLQKRRARRRVRAGRGAHLDMRRILRRSLRCGGETVELAWRRRKLKRRPLVVIADMSGSMERYARLLLKFIYVIGRGLEKVEAFVFSTRLTRLTRQLKEKDIDTALDQAMARIEDWGGGTRIGQSLKTFNYDWGRRVLGRGAIVLIISDGWDRGDIEVLDREMNRLQRSCRRLIWLNPLLGSEGYEPLTRGIQAALPYVDDFLPVHNLASLEQLGVHLQNLSEARPLRRRHPRQR